MASFAVGVRHHLAKLGRVDQVIAHWLVPTTLPLLLSEWAPLEVVCHGSDVRLLAALGRWPCRLLVGRLLDRGASFRFVAEAVRAPLLAMLDEELGRELVRRSLVVAPTIDMPVMDRRSHLAWRRQVCRSPGQRLAVVVGRLVPSKRVDLALEATARLRPAAALAVVGDGPESGRLRALALRRGLRCHFAGHQPRADALAMMAAADVLIHPSSEEGAPTVVREARALGLPVVSCGAGAVTRWARDDDGIHLAAPRADALASALGALLVRSDSDPGSESNRSRK